VHGSRAARTGDHVRDAERGSEFVFEALDHRAPVAAETTGTERVDHEAFFFGAERPTFGVEERRQLAAHRLRAAIDGERFDHCCSAPVWCPVGRRWMVVPRRADS
jgi:hypothetical protein